MATQYMFSPQMNYGGPMSHGPLQQPQAGNGFKNGGFAFRKRFERVDWRKMAAVDVDRISQTLDFNALQENIMNITFCNIESELDVRTVDPNFLKLFKLAQLTIEYLLYSQEYLAGLCTSLEEKAKTANEDENKLKKELEAMKKELTEVKRESHKRRKLLIAQQQLMHAGAGSYNKCPFCPKAFLNGSFLQAHIARRHGSGIGSGVSSGVGSGEPSKAYSPDHGVGDSLANNPHFEAEVSQIKKRLLATEAQLEEERKMLASLRRKEEKIMPMVADRVEAATEQQGEIHKQEIDEIKDVFMRELREVNEKYMASERALAEMEQRYGAKRSYLGTSLQDDDIDNEKELLQQQRAEVAAVREQLQKQMDDVEDKVQVTMDTHQKRRQRHKEKERKKREKELKAAIEDEVVPLNTKQQEMEVLMKSAEMEAKQRGISMYPSDEEESYALGSVTSSLRTPRATSTMGSTMGFTGTGSLNLRTSQFLEQLRLNPTLGLMRDQLSELLAEKVEKCGIPRGAPGIADQVLQNKLAMQRTQRQSYVQRYPNFMELRDHFDKQAHDRAVKILRQKKQSPRNPPPGTGSSPHPGKSPRLPPTHQSRSASAASRTGGQGSSNNTPRSSSAPSPRPRVQATPKSQPQAQPRNGTSRTPLSTGSTTEWTSTQWDSDDDSEDDISGIKPFSPSPSNARLIQSGPRSAQRPTPSPRPSPRHQAKPIVIQSRPLHGGDDDVGDILGSDGEDDVRARTQPVRTRSPASRLTSTAPQPRGQNVAQLSRSIENQLGSRGQKKPVGGVDTMSSAASKKNQAYLEDFDDESDWDDTEQPARPPPRR
ncbi:cilium assembly protein DZIP1L-like isoform X2 [Littorina saxatilis]|uniref:cilium assembly protein DZIP1L-like isoform X2 n=1 Tax=Littorina saxatilis TaxID=31220 RepID=UPI0038B4CD4A